MKSFRYRSGILLAVILAFVTYCNAQVDLSTAGSARKQSSAKEQTTEASAKLKVNETVSRLSALAVESQAFEPRLRSRTQTRVANLLWAFDKVFARDLFLKAWDAAESADRESEKEQLPL